VFPWTSEREVVKELRRLRGVIGGAERERRNAYRGELATWLHGCGFPSAEIAVAGWGRKKGLKRSQVLEDATFDKEQALLQKFLQKGDDYSTAQRKVAAMMKRREAPAAAMVRMARARHAKSQARRHDEFRAPLEADPLSALLIRMLAPFPFYVPDFNTPHGRLIDQLRNLLLTPPRA